MDSARRSGGGVPVVSTDAQDSEGIGQEHAAIYSEYDSRGPMLSPVTRRRGESGGGGGWGGPAVSTGSSTTNNGGSRQASEHTNSPGSKDHDGEAHPQRKEKERIEALNTRQRHLNHVTPKSFPPPQPVEANITSSRATVEGGGGDPHRWSSTLRKAQELLSSANVSVSQAIENSLSSELHAQELLEKREQLRRETERKAHELDRSRQELERAQHMWAQNKEELEMRILQGVGPLIGGADRPQQGPVPTIRQAQSLSPSPAADGGYWSVKTKSTADSVPHFRHSTPPTLTDAGVRAGTTLPERSRLFHSYLDHATNTSNAPYTKQGEQIRVSLEEVQIALRALNDAEVGLLNSARDNQSLARAIDESYKFVEDVKTREREEREAMAAEKEKFTVTLSELEAEMRRMHDSHSNTTAQLELSLRSTVEKAELKQRQWEEEREALLSSKEDVEGQVVSLKESLKLSEEEREQLLQERGEDEEELERMMAELDTVQAEAGEKTDLVNSLRQQLEVSRSENAILQEKLSSRDGLKADLTMLSEQVDGLKEESVETSKENEKLRSEVSELRQQVGTVKGEKAALEKRMSALSERTEEGEVVIRELRDERNLLEKSVEEKIEEIIRLEHELAEERGEKGRMRAKEQREEQEKKEEAIEKIKRVYDQNTVLTRANEALSSQVRDLENQLVLASGEKDLLAHEIAEFRAKSEKYMEEASSKRLQNGGLEHASLKEELANVRAKWEQKAEYLQQQLAQAEEDKQRASGELAKVRLVVEEELEIRGDPARPGRPRSGSGSGLGSVGNSDPRDNVELQVTELKSVVKSGMKELRREVESWKDRCTRAEEQLEGQIETSKRRVEEEVESCNKKMEDCKRECGRRLEEKEEEARTRDETAQKLGEKLREETQKRERLEGEMESALSNVEGLKREVEVLSAERVQLTSRADQMQYGMEDLKSQHQKETWQMERDSKRKLEEVERDAEAHRKQLVSQSQTVKGELEAKVLDLQSELQTIQEENAKEVEMLKELISDGENRIRAMREEKTKGVQEANSQRDASERERSKVAFELQKKSEALKHAEAEFQQWKVRVDKLEGTCRSLESELMTASRLSLDKKMKITTLERMVESAQRRAQHAEEELARNESKWDSEREEMLRQASQSKEMEEILHLSKREEERELLASREAKEVELMAAVQTKESIEQRLRAQLEASEEAKAKVETKLANLETKLQSLSAVDAKLSEVRKGEASLRQKMQTLEIEMEEKDSEISRIGEEMEKERREKEAAQESIVELSGRLEAEKRKNETLQVASSNVQSRLDTVTSERLSLKQENVELSAAVAELKVKEEAVLRECNALREDVRRVREEEAEKMRMIKENSEKEREILKQGTVENALLVEELRGELKRAKSQIETEKEGAQREGVKWETKLEKVRGGAAEREEELNKKVASLEVEIASLKVKVEDRAEEVREVRGELARSRVDVNSVNEAVQQKEEEVAKLKEDREKERMEKEAAQESIVELSGRLEAEKRKNETLQVASSNVQSRLDTVTSERLSLKKENVALVETNTLLEERLKLQELETKGAMGSASEVEEKLSKVIAELSEEKARRAVVSKQESELQSQLNNKCGEVKAKDTELEKKNAEIVEITKTKEDLEVEVDAKSREVSQVVEELQKEREHVSKLKEDVLAEQKTVKSVEQELAAVREEREEELKVIEESKASLGSLKDELQQKVRDVEELKRHLDKSKADIVREKQERDEERKELVLQIHEMEEKAKLSESETLSKLNDQNKELIEVNCDLRRRVEVGQNDARELNEHLKQLHVFMGKRTEMIQQVSEAMATTESDCNGLLSQLKSRGDISQNTIRELEGDVSALTDELKEAKVREQRVEKKLEETTEKYNSTILRLEAVEKDSSVAAGELRKELNEVKAMHQQAVANHEEELAQLTRSLEEKERECTSLSGLKTEVTLAKVHNDSLDEEIRVVRGDLEKLIAEKGELEKKHIENDSVASSLRIQLATVQQEVQEKTKIITSLQSSLDAALAEAANTSQQEVETSNRLRLQTTQLQKSERQLQTLQEEVEELEAVASEAEEMKDRMNRMEEGEKAMEKKCQRLAEELSNAKSLYDESEKLLNESNHELSKCKEQLEKEERARHVSEEQLTHANQRVANVAMELEGVERQMQELEQQHSQALAIKVDLQADVRRMASELYEAGVKAETLEDDVLREKEKNERSGQQIQSLRKNISEILQQHTDAETSSAEEKWHLDDLVGHLKSELEAKTHRIEVLEAEVKELKKKLAEANAMVQDSDALLLVAEERSEELEAIQKRLEEHLERITLEKEEWKKSCEGSFAELSRLENLVKDAQSELEKTKVRLDESSKTASFLEVEKETLKEDLKELSARSEAWQREEKSVRNTLDQLQQQNATLTKNLQEALRNKTATEKVKDDLEIQLVKTRKQSVAVELEKAKLMTEAAHLQEHLHKVKETYERQMQDLRNNARKVENPVKVEDYLQNIFIDQELAALLPPNFSKSDNENDGQYIFGTKKIMLTIFNKELTVRVGGGYVKFEEYVRKYGPSEISKFQSFLQRSQKLQRPSKAQVLDEYIKIKRRGLSDAPLPRPSVVYASLMTPVAEGDSAVSLQTAPPSQSRLGGEGGARKHGGSL